MKILFIVLVLIGHHISVHACTVFGAARNNQILAAKNQDYHITDTRMLIRPPQDGKYGVIHFGDRNEYGFCNTSGMNDQGLWYAGASVPERTDIHNVKNKPIYEGELIEGILEQCATVDEAMDMYKTYFSPHWSGHSLLMDATGQSVIVEFGRDDVIFITSSNDFQVITNFYENDVENARWNNCYRHNVATSILSQRSSISIDLFRDICDATHAEGPGPTVLSTIHDLKTGDIYIYDFHNFNETVKINIHEIMKDGDQYYALRPFFHQLALTSPANTSTVNPQSVTFEWVSNAHQFLLYLSTDPSFHRTEPILIDRMHTTQQASMGTVFLVIGAMAFLSSIFKKKYLISVGIIFFALLSFSCEMDILVPPSPATTKHSFTTEHLAPSSTYYWKVVALNADNFSSESLLRTFTTRSNN